MADKTQTNKELQALVAEGATVVKQASSRITELETQKAASDKRVEEAKAYGPKIVTALIKAGMVNESDRAKCLVAMGDPVKVASQLGIVLDSVAGPRPVGSIETPDASEKEASAGANPMQDVDDNFRSLLGLG